jgi:hypothetical protein
MIEAGVDVFLTYDSRDLAAIDPAVIVSEVFQAMDRLSAQARP